MRWSNDVDGLRDAVLRVEEGGAVPRVQRGNSVRDG